MNRKHLVLVSRVEEELSEIKQLVEKINKGWKYAQKTKESFYLDSVALNLHGFYSALEKIFELIAKEIDGIIPEGNSWHQDLLIQMKTEFKKVRPAVISRDTFNKLDEYRGFRHVVRNVYTFNLSPSRIEPLVEGIDLIFIQIKEEITRFLSFIEELMAEE